MVFTVSAFRRLRSRRAFAFVVFAAMGTALLAAKHGAAPPDSDISTLTVRVASEATAADVARRTDESLLLATALRLGFVHNDPAVRDRLVRNVQFVDGSLNEGDALDEALRLNMHESDTLAARVDSQPTDAELEAYLRAQRSRFELPSTTSFEQHFVSRQKHGSRFNERVREVGLALNSAANAPRSDAGLLPGTMLRASATRIDSRFGAGFAKHLQAAIAATEADAPHEWVGPVPSIFGAHFIRINERRPAQLPPLDEIRGRVTLEYLADAKDERVREALARLRLAYRINVEERS